MRKKILTLLLACLSFVCIYSCGGNDNNGNGREKFTVFDVAITVLDVEPKDGEPAYCPEFADLKLSLNINENSITGFAELIEFGNIGNAIEIFGLLNGSNFSIEPYTVNVNTDPFCSPENPDLCFFGSFILNFDLFEGSIINDNPEISSLQIVGIASGTVTYGETDAIICHAEFTAEYSGKEKMPRGCVSAAELTLDGSRECPAEAISNLCDGYSWLCPVPSPAPFPTPPPGDFVLDNQCEASGCFTVDCSLDITNLQIDINGHITGNILTPEGIGLPISCF
jgi:hypothetical protein